MIECVVCGIEIKEKGFIVEKNKVCNDRWCVLASVDREYQALRAELSDLLKTDHFDKSEMANIDLTVSIVRARTE